LLGPRSTILSAAYASLFVGASSQEGEETQGLAQPWEASADLSIFRTND